MAKLPPLRVRPHGRIGIRQHDGHTLRLLHMGTVNLQIRLLLRRFGFYVISQTDWSFVVGYCDKAFRRELVDHILNNTCFLQTLYMFQFWEYKNGVNGTHACLT